MADMSITAPAGMRFMVCPVCHWVDVHADAPGPTPRCYRQYHDENVPMVAVTVALSEKQQRMEN